MLLMVVMLLVYLNVHDFINVMMLLLVLLMAVLRIRIRLGPYSEHGFGSLALYFALLSMGYKTQLIRTVYKILLFYKGHLEQ